MPNLLVESFIDTLQTPNGPLSGGTLAPTLRLEIRDSNTYVVEQLGYRCDMRSGVPYWVAPTWIDRSETPVRNTAHLPQPEPL